ncbi:MAG: Fis family transcriptional regulator, partial [Nitrospinae bacterium]|nr:Fis family transcriptional regulator [Nitrospinota bacterium]
RTQAANILGINRNTLRKKIQDYNIQCRDRD